eukprot:scaffold35236_cov25-Prasinocladus_malaysianus.AAC.1
MQRAGLARKTQQAGINWVIILDLESRVSIIRREQLGKILLPKGSEKSKAGGKGECHATASGSKIGNTRVLNGQKRIII